MKTIVLRLVIADEVANEEASHIKRFAGTSSGAIFECVMRNATEIEVQAYKQKHGVRGR